MSKEPLHLAEGSQHHHMHQFTPFSRGFRRRAVALFILTAHFGCLAAPALRAEAAPAVAAPEVPASEVPAPAPQNRLNLADLWKSWVKHNGAAGLKLSRDAAFGWFTSHGASREQASLLTNNAQSEGHLTTVMPSSPGTVGSFFQRLFGPTNPAPMVGTVPSSGGSSLFQRLKGWVMGTKPVAVEATAGAAPPVTSSTGTGAGGSSGGFFGAIKSGIGRVVSYFRGPPQFYKSDANLSAGELKSTINVKEAARASEPLAAPKNSSTASAFRKFTSGVVSLRNKLFGGAKPSTLAGEAGKLNLQADMLEKASNISTTQSQIQGRINELSRVTGPGRASALRQIETLKATSGSLESNRTQVMSRLRGAQEGPSAAHQGVSWALYSVGIQAAINVGKQVLAGDKIDVHKAMDFMSQPSFWGGTAGGFLGSLVASNLAAGLLPGAPIFLKILPGFLGAALGFSGGSLALGGPSVDWAGTIGQTLASAAGYALAHAVLGGGFIPSFFLAGAGIASGLLFTFLWNKLHPPPPPGAQPVPPPDLGAPTPSPAQLAPGEGPPMLSPVAGVTLETISKTRDQAYKDYLSLMNNGKAAESRTALERFRKAQDDLTRARHAAAETVKGDSSPTTGASATP